MKLTRLVLLWLATLIIATPLQAQKTNPNYDAELAKRVGADEYGMKSFILVILKSGANTSSEQAKKQAAFRGHLDNINRLVDEKKLIVAGPLSKNENQYRGIFILDIKSKEQAQALLKTDPAISAGYLQADVYQWYGSAALAEYLEVSDKIWQVSP